MIEFHCTSHKARKALTFSCMISSVGDGGLKRGELSEHCSRCVKSQHSRRILQLRIENSFLYHITRWHSIAMYFGCSVVHYYLVGRWDKVFVDTKYATHLAASSITSPWKTAHCVLILPTSSRYSWHLNVESLRKSTKKKRQVGCEQYVFKIVFGGGNLLGVWTSRNCQRIKRVKQRSDMKSQSLLVARCDVHLWKRAAKYQKGLVSLQCTASREQRLSEILMTTLYSWP